MPLADVQELRDLTDYGNLFHHDSNPQGYLTVGVTDGASARIRAEDDEVLQPTVIDITSIQEPRLREDFPSKTK